MSDHLMVVRAIAAVAAIVVGAWAGLHGAEATQVGLLVYASLEARIVILWLINRRIDDGHPVTVTCGACARGQQVLDETPHDVLAHGDDVLSDDEAQVVLDGLERGDGK